MGLRSKLVRIGTELRSAGETALLNAWRGADLAEPAPEPPVVARLIVEVRSDGTRTIARGGLESGGESVTLEAHGTTPAQLAASLARTILTAPALLRQLSRTNGGSRGSRPGDSDADEP